MESFPREAINRPSSAHIWSGTSAGVTHQVLSSRPADQQETNQWSYGEFSNTVMQQQHQQPGPSIRSQTTNTTSGSSFVATEQISHKNVSLKFKLISEESAALYYPKHKKCTVPLATICHVCTSSIFL